MATSIAAALSESERARLMTLETVVERGIDTFVEVGTALLEIRKSRLYRETHATFANYCRERWGFSRQTGYDLITTARVSRAVQDLGHSTPTREQARALAPLVDDAARLRQVRIEPSMSAREVRYVVRTVSAPDVRSVRIIGSVEYVEPKTPKTPEQIARTVLAFLRTECRDDAAQWHDALLLAADQLENSKTGSRSGERVENPRNRLNRPVKGAP